eukprot:GHVN01072680.1.p1 GENE.GHVN01072680.1~~GHVN01072680.1.p1  ORF type:complete len:2255 (+),score=520.91 GHVN01072680.1:127-6765(+)
MGAIEIPDDTPPPPRSIDAFNEPSCVGPNGACTPQVLCSGTGTGTAGKGVGLTGGPSGRNRHQTRGVGSPGSSGSPDGKRSPSRSTEYELVGVLEHEGSSAQVGHYTASLRDMSVRANNFTSLASCGSARSGVGVASSSVPLGPRAGVSRSPITHTHGALGGSTESSPPDQTRSTSAPSSTTPKRASRSRRGGGQQQREGTSSDDDEMLMMVGEVGGMVGDDDDDWSMPTGTGEAFGPRAAATTVSKRSAAGKSRLRSRPTSKRPKTSVITGTAVTPVAPQPSSTPTEIPYQSLDPQSAAVTALTGRVISRTPSQESIPQGAPPGGSALNSGGGQSGGDDSRSLRRSPRARTPSARLQESQKSEADLKAAEAATHAPGGVPIAVVTRNSAAVAGADVSATGTTTGVKDEVHDSREVSAEVTGSVDSEGIGEMRPTSTTLSESSETPSPAADEVGYSKSYPSAFPIKPEAICPPPLSSLTSSLPPPSSVGVTSPVGITLSTGVRMGKELIDGEVDSHVEQQKATQSFFPQTSAPPLSSPLTSPQPTKPQLTSPPLTPNRQSAPQLRSHQDPVSTGTLPIGALTIMPGLPASRPLRMGIQLGVEAGAPQTQLPSLKPITISADPPVSTPINSLPWQHGVPLPLSMSRPIGSSFPAEISGTGIQINTTQPNQVTPTPALSSRRVDEGPSSSLSFAPLSVAPAISGGALPVHYVMANQAQLGSGMSLPPIRPPQDMGAQRPLSRATIDGEQPTGMFASSLGLSEKGGGLNGGLREGEYDEGSSDGGVGGGVGDGDESDGSDSDFCSEDESDAEYRRRKVTVLGDTSYVGAGMDRGVPVSGTDAHEYLDEGEDASDNENSGNVDRLWAPSQSSDTVMGQAEQGRTVESEVAMAVVKPANEDLKVNIQQVDTGIKDQPMCDSYNKSEKKSGATSQQSARDMAMGEDIKRLLEGEAHAVKTEKKKPIDDVPSSPVPPSLGEPIPVPSPSLMSEMNPEALTRRWPWVRFDDNLVSEWQAKAYAGYSYVQGQERITIRPYRRASRSRSAMAQSEAQHGDENTGSDTKMSEPGGVDEMRLTTRSEAATQQGTGKGDSAAVETQVLPKRKIFRVSRLSSRNVYLIMYKRRDVPVEPELPLSGCVLDTVRKKNLQMGEDRSSFINKKEKVNRLITSRKVMLASLLHTDLRRCIVFDDALRRMIQKTGLLIGITDQIDQQKNDSIPSSTPTDQLEGSESVQSHSVTHLTTSPHPNPPPPSSSPQHLNGADQRVLAAVLNGSYSWVPTWWWHAFLVGDDYQTMGRYMPGELWREARLETFATAGGTGTNAAGGVGTAGGPSVAGAPTTGWSDSEGGPQADLSHTGTAHGGCTGTIAASVSKSAVSVRRNCRYDDPDLVDYSDVMCPHYPNEMREARGPAAIAFPNGWNPSCDASESTCFRHHLAHNLTSSITSTTTGTFAMLPPPVPLAPGEEDLLLPELPKPMIDPKKIVTLNSSTLPVTGGSTGRSGGASRSRSKASQSASAVSNAQGVPEVGKDLMDSLIPLKFPSYGVDPFALFDGRAKLVPTEIVKRIYSTFGLRASVPSIKVFDLTCELCCRAISSLLDFTYTHRVTTLTSLQTFMKRMETFQKRSDSKSSGGSTRSKKGDSTAPLEVGVPEPAIPPSQLPPEAKNHPSAYVWVSRRLITEIEARFASKASKAKGGGGGSVHVTRIGGGGLLTGGGAADYHVYTALDDVRREIARYKERVRLKGGSACTATADESTGGHQSLDAVGVADVFSQDSSEGVEIIERRDLVEGVCCPHNNILPNKRPNTRVLIPRECADALVEMERAKRAIYIDQLKVPVSGFPPSLVCSVYLDARTPICMKCQSSIAAEKERAVAWRVRAEEEKRDLGEAVLKRFCKMDRPAGVKRTHHYIPSAGIHHLVNARWLDRWTAYIEGREETLPPGPIDNSELLCDCPTVGIRYDPASHLRENVSLHPRANARHPDVGSYLLVHETDFAKLTTLYGGGNEPRMMVEHKVLPETPDTVTAVFSWPLYAPCPNCVGSARSLGTRIRTATKSASQGGGVSYDCADGPAGFESVSLKIKIMRGKASLARRGRVLHTITVDGGSRVGYLVELAAGALEMSPEQVRVHLQSPPPAHSSMTDEGDMLPLSRGDWGKKLQDLGFQLSDRWSVWVEPLTRGSGGDNQGALSGTTSIDLTAGSDSVAPQSTPSPPRLFPSAPDYVN